MRMRDVRDLLLPPDLPPSVCLVCEMGGWGGDERHNNDTTTTTTTTTKQDVEKKNEEREREIERDEYNFLFIMKLM